MRRVLGNPGGAVPRCRLTPNHADFSLKCFVKYSETQISPSISSGPTKQPEDSSIPGPVTRPPCHRSQSDPSLPSNAARWRATINGEGVRQVSRSSASPIANCPVQMHLLCCHLPPLTDPTLKSACVVYIPCPPPPCSDGCTSHPNHAEIIVTVAIACPHRRRFNFQGCERRLVLQVLRNQDRHTIDVRAPALRACPATCVSLRRPPRDCIPAFKVGQ